MALISLLTDDATILLRWLHVVAAMVWVGSAFALARLDLAMRPRGKDPRPQILLLHAGGIFRFCRAENVDDFERAVHFKWEAYATWASGFALLCLIFCAAPELYLIDPALWDAPSWAAIAVALGLLPAAWLAYDLLCKKSGLSGDALLGALFVFAAALGFLLTHLFAGRAAYPLLGALLATIMTANIAHVIVPAQKRRFAALRAGQKCDADDVGVAATRALHNQYLALPVVFFMLSSHAPLVFAGPHNGAAAALFLAAGFLIRRSFLKRARGLGSDWRIFRAAAVCLVLGLLLSAPFEQQREKAAAHSAGEAIALVLHPGDRAARAIVEQHCVACHAPAHSGLFRAAAGLDFSTGAQVTKHRAEILRAAVYSRAMPPPGVAPPLDEDERLTLLRWAQAAP
ncbi:urate hydroxylase PuuD [Rhodoblastus sp.]|uniref:urate hydroxylase PuuD n=1 Tax=Rhodoblastus sp. TaxID=1962975 RepID=UPI003F990DE5